MPVLWLGGTVNTVMRLQSPCSLADAHVCRADHLLLCQRCCAVLWSCCRCLAGFEVDPHKRCVMHRSRTKLLQPVEGQLSTTHYPGLSRSISLELGNIFREIADIKSAAGREPDKVCGANVLAQNCSERTSITSTFVPSHKPWDMVCAFKPRLAQMMTCAVCRPVLPAGCCCYAVRC